MLVGRNLKVRTGQIADAAVAGAVGEMPACKAPPPAARHVFGDHRGNAAALHFDLLHAVKREERDIVLAGDDGVLPVVNERTARVHRAPAFKPLARYVDFGEHVAQRFGIIAAGGPREMHSHLGAVVAANHGTILDQRHLHPMP